MSKNKGEFLSALINRAFDYADAYERKLEREKSDPIFLFKKAIKMLQRHEEIQLAIQLLEKSAELEYVPAQQEIAEIYEYGIDELGVEPNHTKALKWYLVLAEKEDEDSILMCYDFYYKGLGTSKNLEKSFYYANKSASLGDSQGLRYAGFLYFHGEGVEKNEDKGIEYLRRASKQGDIISQMALSELYGQKNMIDTSMEYLKAVKSSEKEKSVEVLEWIENMEKI